MAKSRMRESSCFWGSAFAMDGVERSRLFPLPASLVSRSWVSGAIYMSVLETGRRMRIRKRTRRRKLVEYPVHILDLKATSPNILLRPIKIKNSSNNGPFLGPLNTALVAQWRPLMSLVGEIKAHD